MGGSKHPSLVMGRLWVRVLHQDPCGDTPKGCGEEGWRCWASCPASPWPQAVPRVTHGLPT